MKLIGHVGAMASLREAVEEYSPVEGATQTQIIETVRAAYGFQSFPQLGVEPVYIPQLLFVNGRYAKDDKSFAITHLVMEPIGDTVQTQTTDQAETFIEDLTATLDEKLGFRFATSSKRLSFVSNLVVEFASPLEDYLSVLKRVTDLVADTLPDRRPFSVKRLAMGAPTLATAVTQVETVESSDFIIERRAGATFDQNRYFSSAPMRTAEHLKLLEQIEGVLLDQ